MQAYVPGSGGGARAIGHTLRRREGAAGTTALSSRGAGSSDMDEAGGGADDADGIGGGDGSFAGPAFWKFRATLYSVNRSFGSKQK